MNMKWSSFKETQLLFENWRQFSNTPTANSLLEEYYIALNEVEGEGGEEEKVKRLQNSVKQKVEPAIDNDKKAIDQADEEKPGAGADIYAALQKLENLAIAGIEAAKTANDARKGLTPEQVKEFLQRMGAGAALLTAFDILFDPLFGSEFIEQVPWFSSWVGAWVASSLSEKISYFISGTERKFQKEKPPEDKPPTGAPRGRQFPKGRL